MLENISLMPVFEGFKSFKLGRNSNTVTSRLLVKRIGDKMSKFFPFKLSLEEHNEGSESVKKKLVAMAIDPMIIGAYVNSPKTSRVWGLKEYVQNGGRFGYKTLRSRDGRVLEEGLSSMMTW